MIARRTVVRMIAGGFVATPLRAMAQAAGPVHRVGFLFFASPELSPHVYQAFVDGLRELGYVEGRNIAMEARFGDGSGERLLHLASELVDLKVDVIMAGAAFAYFPGSPEFISAAQFYERQELLGHRDVSTTQIYTPVLNRGPSAVRSPVDTLLG